MWNKDTKTYVNSEYVLVDADQFFKFSVKEINEVTFTKIPCLLVKNLQPILFNHAKFIEFLKVNSKLTDIVNCLMDAFKSIHNLDDKQMEHFHSYLTNLTAIESLFQTSPQLVVEAHTLTEINQKDLEFTYANKTDPFPRTLIYKNKYKIIRSNFVALLPFIYKAKNNISYYNKNNVQLTYAEYNERTKTTSKYSSYAYVGQYDSIEKSLSVGCERVPFDVLDHIIKVFQLEESS